MVWMLALRRDDRLCVEFLITVECVFFSNIKPATFLTVRLTDNSATLLGYDVSFGSAFLFDPLSNLVKVYDVPDALDPEVPVVATPFFISETYLIRYVGCLLNFFVNR